MNDNHEHPLVSLLMSSLQVKEDAKEVKQMSEEEIRHKVNLFGEFLGQTGFVQPKSKLQVIYLKELVEFGIEQGKSDLDILMNVYIAFSYSQLQDALEDAKFEGMSMRDMAEQVWDIYNAKQMINQQNNH